MKRFESGSKLAWIRIQVCGKFQYPDPYRTYTLLKSLTIRTDVRYIPIDSVMITSKIQGGQEPGVGWSEVPEDGGQREPAGGGRHQPVPRTQGQGGGCGYRINIRYPADS